MPEFNHIEQSLKEIREYLEAVENNLPYSRFHLTGSGPVAELEAMLREYYHCSYALSFSSATNALSAIAISLGLTEEDEVIAAPYNWASSVAGLLEFTPAKILWAEADEHFNISSLSVESHITPKTRAIWACDYEGEPHDMIALRDICTKNDIAYISDAAQSLGKNLHGLPASSLADVWVLSFGAGKKIDAGEGGMILTNSKEWYENLLRFQHPYRIKADVSLDSDSECYPINGRISPMAAIIAKNKFRSMIETKCFPKHDLRVEVQ